MTEDAKPDVRNALLPANRPALLWGLAIVAAIGVGAAATILALRDRLPDPLATHFGGDAPNGYTSITATAWIALGFTLGLGGFFTAAGARAPGRRIVRRLTFGMGISLAAFVAGVFLSTTLPQIGLADASEATIGWLAYAGPLVIAGIVGWVCSALIRE